MQNHDRAAWARLTRLSQSMEMIAGSTPYLADTNLLPNGTTRRQPLGVRLQLVFLVLGRGDLRLHCLWPSLKNVQLVVVTIFAPPWHRDTFEQHHHEGWSVRVRALTVAPQGPRNVVTQDMGLTQCP